MAHDVNLLPAKIIYRPLSPFPLVFHTQETLMDPPAFLGQEPKRSRVKVGASRGSLRSCPGNPAQLRLTSTGMGTGTGL